ncbi:DDE_Tnp_1_7 domain-containing protein [Trichonephila clavipes]|nr:DDE_Tnp_1_7 domain-containing protein [Trichonephila clavipes]
MSIKPDKFGIKFWLASDVRTKYIINGFPYLEEEENRGASIPLKEFVILKLLEPFTGCVTTDNSFTSASLAFKLLEKRTTIVETIRGNRRKLPKLTKQKKDVCDASQQNFINRFTVHLPFIK